MEALWIGLSLGLVAGFSPGPLLTLVIASTLQRGTTAGLRVAAAPLVTDLPIVLLSIWLAGAVPERLLHGLALVGGAFVIYLGTEIWRDAAATSLSDIRAGERGVVQADSEPTDSQPGAKELWQASLVNLLSPHPWLFWIGIGGPQTVGLWRQSGAGAAVGFLFLFYFGLVGSKMLIAIAMGQGRSVLGDAAYRRILQTCAVVMWLLGAWLMVDGLRQVTA